MNANKIQIPYNKHPKVSSLVKSHQTHTQFCQIWSNMKMSNNPAKNEVIIKQYLHSILDIKGREGTACSRVKCLAQQHNALVLHVVRAGIWTLNLRARALKR